MLYQNYMSCIDLLRVENVTQKTFHVQPCYNSIIISIVSLMLPLCDYKNFAVEY